MRTTILAAALAVAASAAMIAPTQAASVTITTGDDGIVRSDNSLRFESGTARPRHWRERREFRDCEYRTTRYWRDGEMVVERERTCY